MVRCTSSLKVYLYSIKDCLHQSQQTLDSGVGGYLLFVIHSHIHTITTMDFISDIAHIEVEEPKNVRTRTKITKCMWHLMLKPLNNKKLDH